jgi:hypothetical protein
LIESQRTNIRDNQGKGLTLFARRRAEVLGIMYEAMCRRFLAATLVLLFGGCASYAWVKPDATAETTARDETVCRAEARDLATGYVYGRVGSVYGGVGAPWGYPPWQPVPYVNPSWQAVAEQRVYDSCMRGRGYELMRTEKKG